MSCRSGTILACVLTCSATLAGCGDKTAPPEQNGGVAGPIVQTAEHGPVRMTITLNQSEITLAERFRLRVEIVAKHGIDVAMPQFDERVADLAIRDRQEYPVEPFEGGWRQRQEYVLDAFLSGQYTIPEMTATFVDRRAGEDSLGEMELSVDEFTVRVTSRLEGEPDPTAFRDIKGPVQLPTDRTWLWVWWTGGGLSGVVALMIVVISVLRRRGRELPQTVLSPHLWALGQLRNLINEQLVERGLVHEFYFRLSMIVRRYIERRFDLRAPRQTTEEFIVEAQDSRRLPYEYCGTVADLLIACDTVKYAQHAPQAEEISGAIDTACDFVAQSAEIESQQVTAA